MRGGEKTWLHVKRGVPIRLEIGPRDVAGDAVFMARRDQPPSEKPAFRAASSSPTSASCSREIQDNLFERALKLRDDNTRTIDSRDEFVSYFTPKNEDKPEIHGGFALCHWADDPAVEPIAWPT